MKWQSILEHNQKLMKSCTPIPEKSDVITLPKQERRFQHRELELKIKRAEQKHLAIFDHLSKNISITYKQLNHDDVATESGSTTEEHGLELRHTYFLLDESGYVIFEIPKDHTIKGVVKEYLGCKTAENVSIVNISKYVRDKIDHTKYVFKLTESRRPVNHFLRILIGLFNAELQWHKSFGEILSFNEEVLFTTAVNRLCRISIK